MAVSGKSPPSKRMVQPKVELLREGDCAEQALRFVLVNGHVDVEAVLENVQACLVKVQQPRRVRFEKLVADPQTGLSTAYFVPGKIYQVQVTPQKGSLDESELVDGGLDSDSAGSQTPTDLYHTQENALHSSMGCMTSNVVY
ncbi:hypothetical protein WJX72_004513 [[Myrmecia] bisecta]|uniref:Uncharacterized protein n=1 Tax=[Myrmecia] bisecta TaxID=41462 RepID=A0AAW1Q3S6_9CHLO